MTKGDWCISIPEWWKIRKVDRRYRFSDADRELAHASVIRGPDGRFTSSRYVIAGAIARKRERDRQKTAIDKFIQTLKKALERLEGGGGLS